jgi:hypothetical protein
MPPCVVSLALSVLPAPAVQDSLIAVQDSRPAAQDLEKALADLRAQVDALKADKAADEARLADLEARYQSLLEEIEARGGAKPSAAAPSWTDRLTLGGYGEIHVNMVNGPEGDQIDLARFVLYLGYRFEDWIQLHSELEIEHALVAQDSPEGEIGMEQLYVDFLWSDAVNVRVGRFLTPVGIVNERHEPTSFNGVERPDFETFVIPTTWSSDGAGIFGNLNERMKYQLYLCAGLDGSKFDAVDGIRGGRQETMAGIEDLAVTGRLDWYPQASSTDLRFGISFYGGGVNNGPGENNPDLHANMELYSADCQYSVGKWDFRGVYGYERINGAAEIGNNVAEAIDGFYVEAARHILPDSWKSGRFARSDAVAFARYDKVDTQASMPAGVTADPAGNRDIYTIGLGFYPTTNLVLKADYQIRDDDTSNGLPERFNLGIGWVF